MGAGRWVVTPLLASRFPPLLIATIAFALLSNLLRLAATVSDRLTSSGDFVNLPFFRRT
jgi:hypothetical protein